MNISVLIPTLHRHLALNKCLSSLSKQTSTPDEIVVVNSDPNDFMTKGVLKKYSGLLPLIVINKYLDGKAPARNLLVETARGEILAFLDQDCIADDHWLKEIRKSFYRTGVMGLLGNNKNLLIANPAAAAEECWYLRWRLRYLGNLNLEHKITKWLIFDLKNAAFRRDFLGHHRFRLFLEEDIVFGYELIESLGKGQQIIYNPKVIAYHRNSFGLNKLVKRRWVLGIGRAKLKEKKPGMFNLDNKIRSDYLLLWLRLTLSEIKHLTFIDKFKFFFIWPVYPITGRLAMGYYWLCKVSNFRSPV